MLEAFKAVHKKNNDVKLVVAGPIKNEVIEIVQRFSNVCPVAAGNIVFTGDIDRVSIRHLVEAIHCCVIPSDFETFGLQMVEAISLGRPVVSTKCGGPQDILRDPRLGILCEKNSADELSEAMLHILNNHKFYRSQEIAAIVDELLGHEAMVAKWASVYEGIVPVIRDES